MWDTPETARERDDGLVFILFYLLHTWENCKNTRPRETMTHENSYASASPTQMRVLRECWCKSYANARPESPARTREPCKNTGLNTTREPCEKADLNTTRELCENTGPNTTRTLRECWSEYPQDLSATYHARTLTWLPPIGQENYHLPDKRTTTYWMRELPPTTRESYYYHARLMRITTTTHGRMTVSSQNPRERDIRELKVNPRALV